MAAGRAAYQEGNYKKAEESFSLALRDAEKPGSGDARLSESLYELARTYLKARDRYMEAEPLCERALTLKEKSVGKNSAELIPILNTLAATYYRQDRDGEDDGHGNFAGMGFRAKELYTRALTIGKKNPNANPLEVAESLNGLVRLCSLGIFDDEMMFEKAMPILERAQQVREKSGGQEHPEVAQCLVDEAALYVLLSQRRHQKAGLVDAEALCKRALALQERTVGSDDPGTASTLDVLGQVYQEKKEFVPAETCFRRALSIDAKTEAAGYRGSESRLHMTWLSEEQVRDLVVKPFETGGYRFVPKVYKDSPKGFTLFRGREELVEQELSHEYPYEYANISVVFPLAKARLEKKLNVQSKWGGTAKLTGDIWARLPAINNLTGGTTPSLIVGTFSGGMNSCCTDYEIFRLGNKVTDLPGLQDMRVYEFTFGDFHGEGKLMAIGHDTTFAYWNASMADSPLPGVVLEYSPKGWRLSLDDMRAETISQEQVNRALAECKQADQRTEEEYPQTGKLFNMYPDLWTVMLNMIYAGHAADAWAFLDKAWPEGKEFCNQQDGGDYLTKAQFIESFKDQLRKSPYWKDLQLLNNGQPL